MSLYFIALLYMISCCNRMQSMFHLKISTIDAPYVTDKKILKDSCYVNSIAERERKWVKYKLL